MKPNPNTAIPLHITPHHLSLTPALSSFVGAEIAKLPRFAGDAMGADVVLRRHHGTDGGKLFSASARLALPGRDLHATATHTDLYTAISRVIKTLARRSIKRKTRRDRASKNLRLAARLSGPRLREALAQWTDPSATSDVHEPLPPVSEAASTSCSQSLGLVERSSSSNPAHGVPCHHLERLAAGSQASGGALRRAAPTTQRRQTV